MINLRNPNATLAEATSERFVGAREISLTDFKSVPSRVTQRPQRHPKYHRITHDSYLKPVSVGVSV